MKLKTSKSAQKRFKVSSRGKLMRRHVNHGHFNAKENGAQRRKKQGVVVMGKSNLKDTDNLLPYNFAF